MSDPITDDEIAALEAKAHAAMNPSRPAKGDCTCLYDEPGSVSYQCRRCADYVFATNKALRARAEMERALTPPVVLSLLARLRATEAERDALRSGIAKCRSCGLRQGRSCVGCGSNQFQPSPDAALDACPKAGGVE